MRRRKIFIRLGLLLLMGAFAAIFICNRVIERSAKERLYSDVQNTPYNKVGLLLGTSKYLAHGTINLYYQYRINAALELLKANKIKYIVISGDNRRVEYNEPETMRADLIKGGVDSSRIYLDYAGFRTFDSMIRLREIFGQYHVTVISQQFHNERALFIASREDIDAIGFNARDVNKNAGVRVQIREKLARVKVFADYLFNKKPKFLGEKIAIPE